MSSVVKQTISGTITTLLTTGLNSLANNALAVSSAFDNTIAQTGDGYTRADIELVVTYGSAPTAGTAVVIWFLRSQDGTNYEDGGTGATPARAPDLAIEVAATTSPQLLIREADIPPGKFKVLLKNDGTSQSMAASGNTLKIRPITDGAY
jgi:hypothetical protein